MIYPALASFRGVIYPRAMPDLHASITMEHVLGSNDHASEARNFPVCRREVMVA